MSALDCLLAQRGCPMAANPDHQSDHEEAVRLSRAYWRLPVAVIFLGSLLLTGVASAGSMIWSLGPVHLIPYRSRSSACAVRSLVPRKRLSRTSSQAILAVFLCG
jgi:hypothetical protein